MSVAAAMVMALAALAAAGLGSACSGSAKLVGAGGACELASDCEEGLVCIPDPTAATGRTCSSDLTSIQKTELPDAAPDATLASADGGDGAIATYPTDSPTPVTEAGAGMNPPADSAAD